MLGLPLLKVKFDLPKTAKLDLNYNTIFI
jgi:hypothetical protein